MKRVPYPGLRPFRRNESDIFFGRQEQTLDLLERLDKSRFLAVLGSSGCGKSSLVRTGLVPGLEAGFLASAGVRWRVVEMRPQTQPLYNLARALLEALGACSEADRENDTGDFAYEAASVRSVLRRGSLGLADVLDELRFPPNTNLLLIVDQFEEIFRYRQLGIDEADAFVSLLLESSAQARWPIFVVITMRADYLGDCAVFRDLPAAINGGQFLTPRLTREQLRSAIEGPARVFGLELEDALVNRLLNDVRSDSYQLPVLQHALMRMWAVAGGCRQDPVLRGAGALPESMKLGLVHYERIGGLENALSNDADDAFQRDCPRNLLDKKGKIVAERLFRCLSERGEGHSDTRRPVLLGTAAEVIGVDWHEVARIVKVFRRPDRNFLTPRSPKPLTPDTLIDISHESLITLWKRLSAWVEEEVESARTYRRLEETALLWKLQRAALWRDPDLALARRWVRQEAPTKAWALRYGEHPGDVWEFLKASVRKKKQEQLRERRRQARENASREHRLRDAQELADLRQKELDKEKELRKVRRRELTQTKRLMWFAMAGFLVAAGFAAYAKRQEMAARVAQQEAQAAVNNHFNSLLAWVSDLVHEDDPKKAKDVIAQTERLAPEVPGRLKHARNLLRWHVESLGLGPVWSDASLETELEDVAVDPRGRWLVAAGQGRIAAYHRDTGDAWQRKALITSRDVPKKRYTKVVFHPKGDWVATAARDYDDRDSILFWQLHESGMYPALEFPAPGEIAALAVSPDGDLVASTGSDGTVRLWRLDRGDELVLAGHDNMVHSIAFDPRGRWLASAQWSGDQNQILIWDLQELSATTVPRFREIVDGDGFRPGLAFHPTGRYLATVALDRSHTIKLWDLDGFQAGENGTRNPSMVIVPDNERDLRVRDLQFLDGGNRLLVAYEDGALREWDVLNGVMQRVLQGHKAGVFAVDTVGENAFSAGGDGAVMAWNLETSGTVRQVSAGDAVQGTAPKAPSENRRFKSVAVAPNGAFFAAGLADGGLQFYSLPDLGRLWDGPGAHKGRVNRLAFSPDGSRLASAGALGEIILWDLAAGETKPQPSPVRSPLNKPGNAQPILSVAFSPDGKRLASNGAGGEILLFDLENDDAGPIKFDGHGSTVVSVSFEPTGKRLISSGLDDKTLVWALEDIAADASPEPVADYPSSEVLWSIPISRGEDYVVVTSGLGQQEAWDAKAQDILVYGPDDANEPLSRLGGHRGAVVRLATSPDGGQLVSLGQDGTLRFWNLDSATELFRIQLPIQEDQTHGWDFDFRCANALADGTAGRCWAIVPAAGGKLAVYDLGMPYD